MTCHCGARFTGRKITHCAVCHFTFSTHANFDRHLGLIRARGASKHHDPAKVGLVARVNGHGTAVWYQPGQELTPERRPWTHAAAR